MENRRERWLQVEELVDGEPAEATGREVALEGSFDKYLLGVYGGEGVVRFA